MKRSVILISLVLVLSTLTARSQNLSVYRAKESVPETVAKLESIIKARGLIFFETVSHELIAEDLGVELDPTEILIFEDPELTTSLILCEQTAALDLPLKIMVWEEAGDTYMGFMDPQTMKRRFMITGCDDTLEEIAALMVRIVNEALRGD